MKIFNLYFLVVILFITTVKAIGQNNTSSQNKNILATDELSTDKKKFSIIVSNSFFRLSAPTETEWSPVYRRFGFNNTDPNVRYDIQYLEEASYYFKSGSKYDIHFNFTKNISPKWDLIYGISYGFMNFQYQSEYQSLEEHIVNEVRGTFINGFSQITETIPVNAPKPFKSFNNWYGYGTRLLLVHNFSLPFELHYKFTESLSLG